MDGTNISDEQHVVVAIIENNSWQVGIAMMDIKNPKLLLTQINDNRQYALSITLLDSYKVNELVYPETHKNRTFNKKLFTIYQRNVGIKRSYFNEESGLERIQQLCLAELNQRDLTNKYLARAAANALLIFVENQHSTFFENHRLRILFNDLRGKLVMDSSTIKNLELISNHRSGGQEGTLLSFINHTNTKMGARLLRGEITNPPAHLTTIVMRQEAVLELQPEIHRQGVEIIKLMHDTDQLTSHFTKSLKKYTVVLLKREIDSVIKLREVLNLLPRLVHVLQHLKSPLWTIICNNLKQMQNFQGLIDAISDKINPNTQYSRKIEEQRIQEMYTVKANADGELDLARVTFEDTLKRINELVEHYSQQHTMELMLAYTAGRGYFLKLPRKYEKTLPSYFMQVVKNKSSINCTTEELEALNVRQNQQMEFIFQLTASQLSSLRKEISLTLSSLHQLSEALALTDMLFSFASLNEKLTAHGGTSCVPNFTASQGSQPVDVADAQLADSLIIHQGKHPVIEALNPGSIVPNDSTLLKHQQFALVTGPNCAGKSTYLRQVALLVIMAQLGCNIPAEYAEIPLFSRIFTRIGTDDSIENNASTFSLEMAETAYILDILNTDSSLVSLVLVDELGRGTSSQEGAAIAWATSEEFLKYSNAYTFFVTHYTELYALTMLYSSVKAMHFKVSINVNEQRLALLHHITNGIPKSSDIHDEDCGISLALVCGMPINITQLAQKVKKHITESNSINVSASKLVSVSSDNYTENNTSLLINMLTALAGRTDLTVHEKRVILHKWRSKATSSQL